MIAFTNPLSPGQMAWSWSRQMTLTQGKFSTFKGFFFFFSGLERLLNVKHQTYPFLSNLIITKSSEPPPLVVIGST
jgi:hypothetical protein